MIITRRLALATYPLDDITKLIIYQNCLHFGLHVPVIGRYFFYKGFALTSICHFKVFFSQKHDTFH